MGRLNAAQPDGGYTPDLREWCEEQNRQRITARMARWYYVQEIDGVKRAEILDGVDGDNAHRLLDGKLADFYGWPPARMAGYRKWLWGCIRMGLTEGSFADLAGAKAA